MMPTMGRCSRPKDFDNGISSSSEIKTIIPAAYLQRWPCLPESCGSLMWTSHILDYKDFLAVCARKSGLRYYTQCNEEFSTEKFTVWFYLAKVMLSNKFNASL